jgi:hypothetical protein
MKRNPALIGLLCGIAVALVALWMSVGSAGAGHGEYIAARVWFPFTMASTYLFSAITVPFIVLAIAQFPTYGWLAGRVVSQATPMWTLWVIGCVHAVLILLLFLWPPQFLS